MSRTGSVNETARAIAENLQRGTIGGVLADLATILQASGIADAKQVATDIVATLLEVPRSWPAINREANLDASIRGDAFSAARRIVAGAPFAYAVGSACFRSLNLAVDERVLIPRPETEVLVGLIMERMESRFPAGESWGTAVDVGTGSGAIALSLATEGRFDRVIATDASLDALDVAIANRARTAPALKTTVEFRHGSLLAPVHGVKAAVLVSNPPYISYAEIEALPSVVRDWEPPIALFSGHDGMSATEGIVRDGWRNLVPGGLLALEVDATRASLVAELVMRHGAYSDIGVMLDLAGRERVVLATRTQDIEERDA
jgi:release factor glutamine methyltransferase